jgi:hypothetical protein
MLCLSSQLDQVFLGGQVALQSHSRGSEIPPGQCMGTHKTVVGLAPRDLQSGQSPHKCELGVVAFLPNIPAYLYIWVYFLHSRFMDHSICVFAFITSKWGIGLMHNGKGLGEWFYWLPLMLTECSVSGETDLSFSACEHSYIYQHVFAVPTHQAAHTGLQWQWWSSPHWWLHTGSSQCLSYPGLVFSVESHILFSGWWSAWAPALLGHHSSATAHWGVGFLPPCSAELLSGPGQWWYCLLAPKNSESNLPRRGVMKE